MIRHVVLPVVCAALLAAPAVSAPDSGPGQKAAQAESLSSRIDAYVREQIERRRLPGVSVAVVRNGAPILEKGYGYANLEHQTPATADTVYQLASVTKQFTAAAVMALVEEGRLSLDETLGSRLPDVPESWRAVTVRQLLNHTSGIPSFTNLPDFARMARKDMTPAEVLKLVEGRPVEFKPGEKWAYNNTGYYLLGMVIEKASGKRYDEYLRERFFKPLGMDSTRLNDLRAVIRHRAAGYSREGADVVNGEYVSPTQPFSAGAVVSSVRDMAKWALALEGEKALKRGSLDQMWAPTKLADGKVTQYGFGWGLAEQTGRRAMRHGGGIQGFSTEIALFPEHRLAVVVLVNMDGGHAGALADGIASLYVPALAPPVVMAIEDKEPQVTRRVREILVSNAEGKLDPEWFTPEAGKFILGEPAKAAGQFLKSLGELKKLELLERKEEGGLRHYTYRVLYARMPLRLMVEFTPGMKVAGIRLGPEG